jgi:hypothetical protein
LRSSTKDSGELKEKIKRAQRKTHDVKKIMGMVSNKLMLNPGPDRKLENKSQAKTRNVMEKFHSESPDAKKKTGYENLAKIRAISPTKLRKNIPRNTSEN